jgi:ferritin-like metal-binding protein YciE
MATDTDRAKLAQYLGEAHATEAALVTTLTAHLTITPAGTYRDLLQHHLDETRGHAAAIERRLGSFEDGEGLIGTAIGLVESVVGQVLSLAKGPVDLLRGTSRSEKLLKNAKDECATEALEIATYDSIEAVARAIGDDETAELAVSHRADEERMLAALRREIPGLVGGTLSEHDVRIVSEPEVHAEPAVPSPGANGNGNGAGGVPIEGYDVLNAGQVIRRLPQLSQDDLARVAAYERGHRNRSGVLNRIDRLRANGTSTT